MIAAVSYEHGKTVVRIRASSLPELFDCPARWAAKHIEGIRRAIGGRGYLGTCTHGATAAYDEARMEGRDMTADDAAEAFHELLWNPGEEVDWSGFTRHDAEAIGLRLVTEYCLHYAPRMRYQGVEIQCSALDVDVGGDTILRFTGTADRIYVDDRGRLGIADLKTGANAVSAAGTVEIDKHIYQLGVYELLQIMVAQDLGYQIEAPARIIGMKTSGDPIIADDDVDVPSRILLGDEDHKGLVQHAGDMIRSGNFWGNPQSMLCTPKVCPAYQQCWWVGNA